MKKGVGVVCAVLLWIRLKIDLGHKTQIGIAVNLIIPRLMTASF